MPTSGGTRNGSPRCRVRAKRRTLRYTPPQPVRQGKPIEMPSGPAKRWRSRPMKPSLKLSAIEQEHLQDLYDAAGVARDELPYTEIFEKFVSDFQDRTFK